MHTIFLLLGGNVGDRFNYLYNAKLEIEKSVGKCVNQSEIYETTPWGFRHDTPFLNQLLIVETLLQPNQLINEIIDIEQTLGRSRTNIQWQERTIDIDILFYDNLIIKNDYLEIPHHRIAERKFVLTPLSEVTPDFIHPVYHKTVRRLLAECNDQLNVAIYKMPLQNAL